MVAICHLLTIVVISLSPQPLAYRIKPVNPHSYRRKEICRRKLLLSGNITTTSRESDKVKRYCHYAIADSCVLDYGSMENDPDRTQEALESLSDTMNVKLGVNRVDTVSNDGKTSMSESNVPEIDHGSSSDTLAKFHQGYCDNSDAGSNYENESEGSPQKHALTNIVMTVSYDGGEYNGFVGPNHFFNQMKQSSDSAHNKAPHLPSSYACRSISNEILRAIAVVHGYLPNRRKRKKRMVKLNLRDTEEYQAETDDIGYEYFLPTERRFSLIASSRTDKGVHAMETACQYLSFDKDPPLGGNIELMMDNVNRLLPDDIKIRSMIYAPTPDFNVRFHNMGKIYMYKVDISECPNLFDRKYYWQIYADRQFRNTLLNKFNNIRKEFSFDRMRSAADAIQGTHNFEGFRKKSRGNEKGLLKDPICTIERIDIERQDTQPDSGKFHILIKGDRFLYKMVRGIVSHMVLVGYDVLTVDQIKYMLESGTEIPHIQYAPSVGLYLSKVIFERKVEQMLEDSKARNKQRYSRYLKSTSSPAVIDA